MLAFFGLAGCNPPVLTAPTPVFCRHVNLPSRGLVEIGAGKKQPSLPKFFLASNRCLNCGWALLPQHASAGAERQARHLKRSGHRNVTGSYGPRRLNRLDVNYYLAVRTVITCATNNISPLFCSHQSRNFGQSSRLLFSNQETFRTKIGAHR